MRLGFAGGALAVVVGALVGSCAEDEQAPESADNEGEGAYAQCLRDAGFTDEQVALFTEGGEPDDGGETSRTFTVDDYPNLDALVETSAECAVASGTGESGQTPERIADDAAATVGIVDCMRSRGWPEFPDPVPSLGGGLALGRAQIPSDAEQRTQFLDDFDDCSMEHRGVPLGEPIDDEGNLLEDGPAEDDHDHSEHDH